jgi:hypothetical protein
VIFPLWECSNFSTLSDDGVDRALNDHTTLILDLMLSTAVTVQQYVFDILQFARFNVDQPGYKSHYSLRYLHYE